MPTTAPEFTLNNGTKMPAIGLGCWMGDVGGGQRVNNMCEKALKIGYRHVDTAAGYGNEKQVGEAIRASGIPRNEIYVTTKLLNTHHHRVREAFEKSLQELDCEYIDLYLMHWPLAEAEDGSRVLRPTESPTFVETYKEMEKLLETGKVKTIGVSNFSIKTLNELLPHVKVVPAVNQVEVHPCWPQDDLIKYCEEKQIQVVAYYPLGNAAGVTTFFEHEGIKNVAAKYNVTPAQILLSWAVQRKTVIIPKSENEQRLKQNMTLIQLAPEDFKIISGLHKEPGMHKTLLPYHSPDGTLFGWTYEDYGWDMVPGGYIVSKSA